MSSKVLIGITSKNRFSILPKSIDSAIGQEYANKVVAVYDDNSNDRTPELENVYPNVKWYFSKEENKTPQTFKTVFLFTIIFLLFDFFLFWFFSSNKDEYNDLLSFLKKIKDENDSYLENFP